MSPTPHPRLVNALRKFTYIDEVSETPNITYFLLSQRYNKYLTRILWKKVDIFVFGFYLSILIQINSIISFSRLQSFLKAFHKKQCQ